MNTKYQKIGIAGDHAGFLLKEKIKSYLEESGYFVRDFGTDSEESVDYPDYSHPLAEAVEKDHLDLGILICGSGNGVAMAANRHSGIRAAIVWEPELAKLGRSHNNANVLVLPARFIDEAVAKKSVDKFLNTEFEGGRHQRRVDKINS
jgi:ribose 5-phosphate isomerase B